MGAVENLFNKSSNDDSKAGKKNINKMEKEIQLDSKEKSTLDVSLNKNTQNTNVDQSEEMGKKKKRSRSKSKGKTGDSSIVTPDEFFPDISAITANEKEIAKI